MNKDNRILVGKIVAPQGIQGDVRVQTYTANPTDFANLRVWSGIFGVDDFKFIRVVPNSDVIIAHVRGYEDRTSAEHLRGTRLFINRDTLPDDVHDGEYYQADLIGFDVVRGGENLGTVVCFQNYGAGDIIQTDDGNMYSFIGAVVDFDKKIIMIK
ncbi:MAG: ribosome maturation factor RimM [Alphaproteobacteria bacterium]